MDERRLRVEGLGRGLPDPRSLLEAATQRLDDRAERLANGLVAFLRGRRDRMTALGERLRGLERLQGDRSGSAHQTELSAALAGPTSERVPEVR
jgi:exonuclease VII large subunit